ncbi:hypothetical protein BDZ91DRAFT_721879, partial [Kalaharituber pfeilii]
MPSARRSQPPGPDMPLKPARCTQSLPADIPQCLFGLADSNSLRLPPPLQTLSQVLDRNYLIARLR